MRQQKHCSAALRGKLRGGGGEESGRYGDRGAWRFVDGWNDVV